MLIIELRNSGKISYWWLLVKVMLGMMLLLVVMVVTMIGTHERVYVSYFPVQILGYYFTRL